MQYCGSYKVALLIAWHSDVPTIQQQLHVNRAMNTATIQHVMAYTLYISMLQPVLCTRTCIYTYYMHTQAQDNP